LENLVWAPKDVGGQHALPALKEVVDKLRKVEADKGDYEDVAEALKTLGNIAAARR
jgi:hypothetical protein